MSTIPPVSDPRFDLDYNEPEAPKQKRSVWATCLIGCLVMAVIVFVIGAAAIFWVMRNARGWAADFTSQVVEQGIDASQLPAEEKAEIKVQVKRVADAFRSGEMSGEQLGMIMQKIAESPLLPSLMVAAIDTAYIQKSGLTDEEKTAANETLQRFLRGMMEEKINQAETVHSGPELVQVYAQLRADCERVGHALGQRDHDADRWIAATALRLGVPIVSNDRIFANTPGLVVEPLPTS